MEQNLTYKKEPLTGNTMMIRLKGKILEKSYAEGLISEIEQTLHQHTNFIFDLEKLEMINSSGLNVFISLLTKIRNNGGDLALIHLSKPIQQLILVTKLHSIFPIFDSEKEALSYFNKNHVNS